MRNLIVGFLCLMLALVGCDACTAPVTVGSLVPGAENPRAPFVLFHMDTDFTPAERANAQTAADIWHKQTGGLAIIILAWDLDFSSISNLSEHKLRMDNLVIRAESGMQTVADEDDSSCPPDDPRTLRDEHQCTLGWMSSGGIHKPFGGPVHGAFIVDRLVTDKYDIEVQVMLHEFGHALGLPHVDAVQAIMYPSAVVGKTACLRHADLQAFCQVNVCGSTKMLPCE